MAAPTKLIIVCCHAIYLGGPTNGHSESEFLLADFQRGETPTFVEHIKAGIRCLSQDRGTSALAFSGAPTRSETKLSEARSYANLAFQNQYFNLLPFPPSPAADTDMDIILEERALDSFHNILFSMTLFWDRFRTWPVHVTVVSHGFKKPRIMGHCRVIGLSEDMVTFVGIDPPGGMGDEGEAEGAMNGVKEALRDWQEDPMGRGEKLAGKRRRRNVWGVWQGVFEGGAGDDKGGLEIELDREGERLVPEGRRPWR